MKLTKFGILENKTTSLFTSIRDCIPGGCAKILEIPEGKRGKFWGPILENRGGRGGHTANHFRGGGMDIFWNHTIIRCIYLSSCVSMSRFRTDLNLISDV